MDKTSIKVPEGIRFLSDWKDFRLSNFPNKCIINKQIPGCGFTEYCIRSNENIILCSPRKMLLKNKFNQHQNEVYLVVNELDKDLGIDKDLTKEVKDHGKSIIDSSLNKDLVENTSKETFKRLYSEIESYMIHCYSSLRSMKILVTYDSYHIVVDILSKLGCFDEFYTVIDEFQSILHDARFKSTTEIGFLNYLKLSNSAIFASATPMMDEYLEMLSDFNSLPYYELDWYTLDLSRVIKPDLDVYLMRSVGEKAKEVIDTYLQGNFERIVVMRDGKPMEIISDEAVIYVNSVNHIISIIKKCGLVPEQCNILCSDTEDNRKRIKRKLGKGFDIGSVPLKFEKPKMFTFCTRTVYLGADFYSLCARSFIFSDSNSDCLAVDISEDLPQILGRQRLFENPWKNSATFYYRTTADYRKMSGEDFENIIKKKERITENLLKAYNDSSDSSVKYDLASTYQYVANTANYKDNYVAVNKVVNSITGEIILQPTMNELVIVNEIRAFKIQQIDYKDRFTVFSTIHNQLTRDDIINQEVSKFMKAYDSYTTRYDKLKLLCESNLSKETVEVILGQIADSDEIKSYYTALGPQKLRGLSYDITRIRRALGIIVFSDELLYDSIYSNFKEGDKYIKSNLKLKLGDIYSSINYQSIPKANDIENWFEVKEIVLYEKDEKTGKRKQIRGYELIKSKEQELRSELKYAN